MINQLRYLSLDIWHLAPVVVPLAGVIVLHLWWFAWARVPHLRLQSRLMPWVFGVYAIFAGYLWWYYHRPLPSPENRELFSGIKYTREVLRVPRPLVIHIVDIDLKTPGLEFVVTPGDNSQGREIRARKTSDFLREFKLNLAINGAFFSPWIANDPVYHYPRTGNPVDVAGLAVAAGSEYSKPESKHFSLAIDANNLAYIGQPTNGIFNAISGRAIFLTNSVPTNPMDQANGADALHPRTAVALSRRRDRLFLIIVDGRQPNYSEGVTLTELANLAARHGAAIGLNLDGGGSSTLVMADETGEPLFLNVPIRGRIPPGRERPVGNHLGLRIRQ